MEAVIEIRDMVVVSGTISRRKVGLGVQLLSAHHLQLGPVATRVDISWIFGLYRVARNARSCWYTGEV
jgi:hypothetical protein